MVRETTPSFKVGQTTQKFDVLLILLVGMIPLLWYMPGHLIAKGDYFPYILGIGNLRNDFYLWLPDNLGNPTPTPAYAFFGLMWGASQVLMIDIGLWQTVLFMIYFAGAMFSMLCLAHVVYPGQGLVAITAGMFYLFNVFLVSTLLNIGMMWIYAFLPLLIALLIRNLTQTQNTFLNAFYFAVVFTVIASIASVNLADDALIIIALASALLYFAVLDRKMTAEQLAKKLLTLATMTFLLSVWWIVPLLNYYLPSSTTQLFPQVSVAAWSWTHARASFLNLFWLNGVWGWRPEYSPFYYLYSNNAILLFLLFAPFLLASAAPLFKEKRKISAYFVIVIAFFMFLAKGLHEPLGFVNLFIYDNIPYMAMFREPVSKFTIIMIPFLALLIGYSAVKAARVLARNKAGRYLRIEKLVTFGLILIFIVTAFPIFMNPIENKTEQIPYSVYVQIPQYWYEVNEWFNTKAGDFKILVTPLDDYYQVPYSWGYFGSEGFIERLIEKPVISPSSSYAYKTNPDIEALLNQLRETIRYNRTQEFETILGLLGVKYILQRNDLDYQYMVSSGRDIASPDKMRDFLSSKPNIRLVQIVGKLDVYEYTKAQPYVRVFRNEQPDIYHVGIENTTVFTVAWNFSSLDQLKAWKNRTLEGQFGALCRLNLENGALKFEIWNSTWGWKIVSFPLIAIQEEAKYDLKLDVKGENAHQVHIKTIEYNSNMEITHAEYTYYVGDGTFDWKDVRINYVPKNESTTFLSVTVWSGSETDKPLPNTLWIDNVEIRGYVTRLKLSNPEALETFAEQPLARVIEYEKIDPTKIIVKVEAFKPFTLAINEAYDGNWRASLLDETHNSIPIFSVMNGFPINRTGELVITLEYVPQKWFYASSAISMSTLIVCAAYVAYLYGKGRTRARVFFNGQPK